ncbi:MAG: ThuA domain-containing protein [Bryobacteraceae bacterium]
MRLLEAALLAALPLLAQAPRVTIVTGGHDHEPSFYAVFDAPRIKARVDPHPVAFTRDLRRNTDVLVLYDMLQDIPEAQRANLRQFAEAGKGIVVLHHALCSYNGWEWYWRELVGGSYLMKSSTFLHDVDLEIEAVTPHAITKGLAPMKINDETYHGMWISPSNKVLLRTGHPTSDGPVAWISAYDKSRVVVIQLGHGPLAHRHEGFRKLVLNAIDWAAGRGEGSRAAR